MNNQVLNHIATVAYSFKETVYHTYNVACLLLKNNVPGDFVECGVAAGAQIAAMQVAIREFNRWDKLIYAFDSFEGIPLAGEFDTEQPGIGAITHDKHTELNKRLVSSGITVHSEGNVIDNFNAFGLPMGNMVLVKGWFQHTLPAQSSQIRTISLLRLDGDLHESTLVCLQHLYPKVADGGIVIIDDYALTGCNIAVQQYFDSIGTPLPEMVPVEGSGGVVYFTKKM